MTQHACDRKSSLACPACRQCLLFAAPRWRQSLEAGSIVDNHARLPDCPQVCAALPKLQMLDDIKLGRTLVPPVSRPAHTHRETHSASAMLAHLSPTASPRSSSPVSNSTHLFERAFSGESNAADAAELPMPPQHAGMSAIWSGPGRRKSRQQRPASASSLHQRLPPVAMGHNQPGSYLLYSLNQLPADSLVTAQTGATPATPAIPRAAVTKLHPEGTDAPLDVLVSAFSGTEPGRLARPASAGVRRAESRLQSPVPSDTSRSASCYAWVLLLMAVCLKACAANCAPPYRSTSCVAL